MSATTSLTVPTEEAYAELAAVLARGTRAPFNVLSLTDEELTVLTGADSDQLAPRPWWDAHATRKEDLIQAVALRSLTARGIVFPSRVDPESESTELALDNLVLAVLAARRASSAIVIAERRSETASWFLACYVQGEHGVIEEEVTHGGVHHFTAAGFADLAEELAAFCNPMRVSAPEPASRVIDLVEVAKGAAGLEDSGDAQFVTTVTIVLPDTDDETTERSATVLAYPDNLEFALPASDAPRVDVTAVTHATLIEAVRGLVEGAEGPTDA